MSLCSSSAKKALSSLLTTPELAHAPDIPARGIGSACIGQSSLSGSGGRPSPLHMPPFQLPANNPQSLFGVHLTSVTTCDWGEFSGLCMYQHAGSMVDVSGSKNWLDDPSRTCAPGTRLRSEWLKLPFQ